MRITGVSQYDKGVVREALLQGAEMYVERARKWYSFDGKTPKKGSDFLIKRYFDKARILQEFSEKIK